MSLEQEKKPAAPLPQPARHINIPVEMQLFYSNAVQVGYSNTEMQLTATINGRPICLLVVPFAVAKSLAKALDTAITNYERRSSTEILDLQQINEKLKNNPA